MTENERMIRNFRESMNISNRKDITERPDIGRPTTFLTKKDKQRNRNTKTARKELATQLKEW